MAAARGLVVGEALSKVFDDGTRALDGISFRAEPGRVLVLLGPSGCGKSTLLRIVAGLERASSGHLSLDGRPLDAVPPGERDVGFVFQSYALYPHLTVARNLTLGLEVRRVPREEIARRLEETAALLGLTPLLDRRPAQLSGGQQQRVAVGRALIRRPGLYLMDEPLSNLDAQLRESMRTELKALFRKLGATVLYVTHDQSEAMSLADAVLVLKDGRARQLAPPAELYARPADLFTATFVGSPSMTVWRGRVSGQGFVAGGLRLPAPAGAAPEAELCAGVRPEDVSVSPDASPGALEGTVELAERLSDRTLLTIRLGGTEDAPHVRALVPPRELPARVWVRFADDALHWFDAESGARF